MMKFISNAIYLLTVTVFLGYFDLCLAYGEEEVGGWFLDQTTIRLPFANDNSIEADFGDVDNDGDIDVVVANAGQDKDVLLINLGNGFFEDQSYRLQVMNSEVSTDVDFADIDNDGDLDLGVAKSGFGGGGQCRILINDGKGFFSEETTIRLPPLSASTRDLDFGDVDGDGDVDIVMANVYVFGANVSRQNRILINNGHGYFIDETLKPDGTPYRFPIDNASPRSVVLGDVDNDGDLDIVWANRIDNEFMGDYDGPQNRLWLNDGLGFFQDVTDERFPIDADSSRDVAMGDVDNDGDLDIYFGNAIADNSFTGGGQQNRLYINNGNGYFTDETTMRIPTLGKITKSVDFGDVDNDGDLDIVEANSRHENGHQAPLPGQQNRILINDGNGFFTDESVYGLFSRRRLPFRIDNSYDIDLGDVDGDGDLDMFVAERFTQNRILINHRF